MTTDAIYTDENLVELPPRNLGVLLSLETYQDMTDEEINMVLAYKIDMGVRERMLSAQYVNMNLEMEQRIADNKSSCDRAHDALQSILNRSPVLQRVEV